MCSLISKENQEYNLKLVEYINKRKNAKSILIAEAKLIPTGFFIISILVMTVMLFQFVPSFSLKSTKTKSLKFFSDYYNEINFGFKVKHLIHIDLTDVKSSIINYSSIFLHIKKIYWIQS